MAFRIGFIFVSHGGRHTTNLYCNEAKVAHDELALQGSKSRIEKITKLLYSHPRTRDMHMSVVGDGRII
jgi:hypothetical protein